MKQTSIVIILVSLLSVIFSFTISAYTNEEEYNEKYWAIDRQELGSSNASAQFHKLRDEYLSYKYMLQDYALTFLILGLSAFVMLRKGNKLYAPSSNLKAALIGFSAALLTTGTYIGDLFLEYSRGAYPSWADSLGIPLIAVPFLAFILLGWAAINMLALKGKYQAGALLFPSQIKRLQLLHLASYDKVRQG